MSGPTCISALVILLYFTFPEHLNTIPRGLCRHIKVWVARSLWALFILLTTYSAIGCVMADVDRIGTVHYSSVIFASHSSYLDLVMASSPWRDSLAPQSTQAITSMSMCVSLGSCDSHDSF